MHRLMRTVSWCAVVAALAGCSPRQISDSGFGAYDVSVATWSDGFAVAWYDTRDGNAEVYVRRLDAEGREAGPEMRVTTTAAESYEADIARSTAPSRSRGTRGYEDLESEHRYLRVG